MRLVLSFAILGALITPAWTKRTEVQLNKDFADQMFHKLVQTYGAAAAVESVYVGSEACMACHQNKRTYRRSLHATGLKMATDDSNSLKLKDGIVADYDKNRVDDFKQGLDFNTINSVFDRYKPNAPILGYSKEKGYTITIARIEYKVGFVHGGSGTYKQRFVLRFPVTDRPNGFSADYYYSPVQFNEGSQSYVVYSGDYWWNTDNTPKITGPITARDAARIGKSFNKDCVGCHSTVFGVGQDVNGEWVVRTMTQAYTPPGNPHYLDLTGAGEGEGYNIGCERCHGPGSRHIINRGNPKMILNPETAFTPKQQNELCGSCHSRGTSIDGKHEYPLSATGEDYGKHLGDDLYAKYWIDKPGRWPDGKTSRQHHQQLQDLMKSSKWDNPFHKVTCGECHDVHNPEPKHMRTSLTVDGTAGGRVTINVSVDNNTLCLACHAGFGPFQSLRREDIVNYEANRSQIGMVTSAHTRHLYNPEGRLGLSRCVDCHMAKMASSGDAYDMSSHTFEVVPPERTLRYQDRGGMPNSCATCHRTFAPALGLPADSAIGNWTEASDKALAEFLQRYLGPEGIWWKTKE